MYSKTNAVSRWQSEVFAHNHIDQPIVLCLIRRLCKELAVRNITYCHWKSNDVLARSASGENDLDLLVSRADAERMTALLHELGFKAAQEPAPWSMPGILDYYGYDHESGKLVHAHIHYQLILGEDMTKNYHLPLEKAYLASSVQGELFRTPAPAFELVIFIIRMILKHSTWDTILGRWGKLSKAEYRELGHLLEKSEDQDVGAVLRTHLPYIDAAFLSSCVQVLQPGCPIWQRIGTGHQLQRRLTAYARRTPWQDIGLRYWRRAQLAYRRRFGQLPRKQLCRGGALIAIAGGDGSGKSSAVEAAHQWLAGDFAVIKTHLGKPPWSRTTKIIRAFLKLERILTATPYIEWAAVLHEDRKNVPPFAVYCLALRAVCAARDIYWAYRDAQRNATNGNLVLCDRFPLPYLTWMEAPQIEHLVAPGQASWLLRKLIQWEKRYYQAISLPDLLVVLRIDPTIAAERRADESTLPVLARNQEIWALDWKQCDVHLLDASQPLPAVHAALKSILWTNL